MVQRTRVIKTRKSHSGESSPYWDWVNNRMSKLSGERGKQWQHDGEVPLANPDMLDGADAVTHKTAPETQEIAELIREAMGLLSEQQRRVVDMMAEGRTFAETAKLLKMSPSTMRNHLNRARKKIMAHVTQKGV